MLKKLCPFAKQMMNQKRFEEDFGPPCEETRKEAPEDWKHLFEGNSDDKFRLGIGVSRRSLKLYSPFYAADVIIASPLGLRLVTGAAGDKGRDFDFLSSV